MCGGGVRMDVTYIDSNGHLQVYWWYFIDVVRVVGMFITIVSTFSCGCALVGGYSDIKLFVVCLTFGFVLTVEGTIASFFKVG
jgi:hypothetical protein